MTHPVEEALKGVPRSKRRAIRAWYWHTAALVSTQLRPWVDEMVHHGQLSNLQVADLWAAWVDETYARRPRWRKAVLGRYKIKGGIK